MLGITLDKTERKIKAQMQRRMLTEAHAYRLLSTCIILVIVIGTACIYGLSTTVSTSVITSVSVAGTQLFFAAVLASTASSPSSSHLQLRFSSDLCEHADELITSDTLFKALIADNNKNIEENERLQAALDQAILRAYVLAGTTPLTSGCLFIMLQLIWYCDSTRYNSACLMIS
jgi:hypothetical protein